MRKVNDPKVKRKIIRVERFRNERHQPGQPDSVRLILECGHTKKYKPSKAPKGDAVYCKECLDTLWNMSQS